MRYDVAVIGAGPAGSTAARFLAKKGFKVVLIDKENFPRRKVCGGGITSNVWKEFPYVEQFIHKFTDKLVLHFQDKVNEVDIKVGLVEREIFDRDLVNLAVEQGVELMEGKKATLVCEHILKIINITIFAGDIVDASGVNSQISKQLGYPPVKGLCIVGKSYSKNDNKAHIYIFDNFEGYAWIFPKENYLHIGIGGTCKGKELSEQFKNFLKEHNLEIEEKTAARIPSDIVDLKPYKGTIILVGDAARFINPLTGEGIYYAIKSGKEAAEVIVGEREYEDYPSFREELQSYQNIRDMGVIGDLDLITDIADKDKKLHDDFVGFLLGDYKPPEVSKRSEKTRRDKYQQVLKRL